MSQSVERAIDVLTLVGEGPETPAAIARHLDVHRSTALRIVELLTERRLLRKLADGRYGIGPAVITLAARAADQFDLAQLAHPLLVELSEGFDQTIHLAELQGDHIVYIDKVDPRNRSIRLTSRVGQNVPLHTASVAKAILAFQPTTFVDAVLRDEAFEPYTAQTITSREMFDASLARVRQRGWSTDDGEREDYINAIGVPIRDATGNVVAAVSAIDLKVVNDLQQMERRSLAGLRDAAAKISAELGWDTKGDADDH